MMNGEEFCFLIQVLDHQQVHTEQVSLMIKLSDIKTKSIFTRLSFPWFGDPMLP